MAGNQVLVIVTITSKPDFQTYIFIMVKKKKDIHCDTLDNNEI